MRGKMLVGILFGVGIFLALVNLVVYGGATPVPLQLQSVPLREALWSYRALDVMGQVALLLTSTYGILVLVKERD